MVQWLEADYGLNAAKVSSVLGISMIYDVAEVVGPQPHVVAKAPKSVLAALRKTQKPPVGLATLNPVEFRRNLRPTVSSPGA